MALPKLSQTASGKKRRRSTLDHQFGRPIEVATAPTLHDRIQRRKAQRAHVDRTPPR